MQVVNSVFKQIKNGCFKFFICCFCSTLHLAMRKLKDDDISSNGCISKQTDALLNAPDASGKTLKNLLNKLLQLAKGAAP